MLRVIIANLYIWIILPCFLSSIIIVKPLGSVFIAILIFLGTILIFTFPCLTCIHYNVKQRKNRNLKHSLQNFKPKTNLTSTWCMHLVLTLVMFVLVPIFPAESLQEVIMLNNLQDVSKPHMYS